MNKTQIRIFYGIATEKYEEPFHLALEDMLFYITLNFNNYFC